MKLFDLNPKTIRYHLYVSPLFILLIATGCASTNYHQSMAAPEFNIDGVNDEWPELTGYDQQSKFQYGIFNDKDNLYVLMSTEDLQVQRKIVALGLTLWIDSRGKKNQNTGITYPLSRMNPEEMAANRAKMSKTDREGRTRNEENMIKSQIETLGKLAEIEGFFGEEPILTTFDQLNSELEGALGYDDNYKSLVYEMKIPINLIKKDNESGIIGVGFETGSIDMSDMGMQPGGMNSAGGRSMGGGRSSSMGGRSSMAGGGMPGGGMGMRDMSGGAQGNQMKPFMEPAKLWIKVQLVE